jgi:hypothetical protein
LNAIICALCSTSVEEGADNSQGGPNRSPSKSNIQCPHTRTLICWASKYFDHWLAEKDKSDTMMSINVRMNSSGWKSAIIFDFFKIKDHIFQQDCPDFENPALGE